MSAPVLIVDDDTVQQKLLQALLKKELGFGSSCANDGETALKTLESHSSAIKLVILDVNMPGIGGMKTLEKINQEHPTIPVIMLTGATEVDAAVKAMKLGAIDFINKPYEAARMAITIKNALKMSMLSREVKRLNVEQTGHFSFDNLIGNNGGLAKTVKFARKAASTDIPVLISGETGVGKEVFAKAIHGESTRAGAPFIAVNCGAIPQNLVESTLFGHEKGAFTGATEKTAGKFREADGGTIFLDEVGELPLESQVKLLRTLQQKEVEPVGAARPINVNVRIISATNRDLEAEVKKGNFREDLYFRLNVLALELPPLRQRKQDIPDLARHFLERFCAREGHEPLELSPKTEKYLSKHEWPGNVRELENSIARAHVLADGIELLPEHFTNITAADNENGYIDTDSLSTTQSGYSIFNEQGTFKTIDQIEREVMQLALNHFNDNTTAAAKALGMAKSTFYRKLKS